MKFFQSGAVIALFLSNSMDVNAVQIRNERQELVQQLSALKDEDLINKVNKNLANAPKLAENKDDAVKTAEEMKVVEEAMGKRVLDRLTGAPQYGHNYGPYGSGDFPYVAPPTPYSYGYPGYPYYYPVGGYGWGEGVAALKAYHDLILGYEAQNAIAGMVHPSVDVVTEALKAANAAYKPKEEKKEEEKKADAPKAASLVQLNSEGVPVYVKPTLEPNAMAEADIGQRDYVIDGVNGFDLVQLDEEESVVLQVNGSPIYVKPESMQKTNTEAQTNLGVHISMGFDDDIYFSQKQMTKQDLKELNDFQTRLTQINNKIAKDHSFVQMLPDEPYTSPGGNVATIDGVTVTGMVGNEDLGEEATIGPDHVTYAHSHNNAVLAAKRTLPDTPYTDAGGNVATNGGDKVTGMVGNEDLGETAVVGADTVKYRKQY